MRKIKIGGIALFGGLVVFAAALFAQNAADVEITTTDLGSGIHAIVAQGGNMAISIGPDGVYVIDDQYAALSERLLETIGGLTDGPIRYVVNTHWHGDHTGGNEAFGAIGAAIVSHDNVRTRMEEGMESNWFGRSVEPQSGAVLPAVTFSEDASFHFNGHDVRLIHAPAAHTDGDTIVHFIGANVLHMGDTYFNGWYPYVDVASGGSTDGMIAALALGLSLSDENTVVIPGHGPLGGRAELQAAHDMLVEVRTRVQGAINEGRSEDDAVAVDLLADLNEDWDWQFITAERMVRLTYHSLTQ